MKWNVLLSVLLPSLVWAHNDLKAPLERVLVFSQLDLKQNTCEDYPSQHCQNLMRKLSLWKKDLQIKFSNFEPLNFDRVSSERVLKLQMQFASDMVENLKKEVQSAPQDKDYRSIVDTIGYRFQILLNSVYRPRLEYVRQNSKEDYRDILVKNSLANRQKGHSDKLHMVIENVIVDPGLDTVRELVETAQETYGFYNKSNLLNHQSYPPLMRQQIHRSFKRGEKYWDKACWVCGVSDYEEAVYEMINFSLILGS